MNLGTLLGLLAQGKDLVDSAPPRRNGQRNGMAEVHTNILKGEPPKSEADRKPVRATSVIDVVLMSDHDMMVEEICSVLGITDDKKKYGVMCVLGQGARHNKIGKYLKEGRVHYHPISRRRD